ncbi:esterase/lipase family protein [Methylobacterium marchantiae]|uniref:Esterase/lipase family protein n=1 Tax=Methylobacterium marchantiae TaxID=600331 RepID=A0ABW3WT58_9HYPH|nr:2-hydroxy-6-oxononadienedioate/2-hydroxy-6-oxononatrienedioate hydrolase [Methylobacterium marchantiae]
MAALALSTVGLQTRDSARQGVEGVVLLHGIARRSASLGRMERAFRAEGYQTLNIDYPGRRASIESIVAGVAPQVDAFASGVDHLHFVTHSMGGLVARGVITRHRPANLGRVVMLGTPNGGSEVANFLHRMLPYRLFFGPAGAQLTTFRNAELSALLGEVDFPLGIIAANRSFWPIESLLILPRPNDGRVSVARTQVAGMTDHLTIGSTHDLMILNRTAIAASLRFIRHGRFRMDDVTLFASDLPSF